MTLYLRISREQSFVKSIPVENYYECDNVRVPQMRRSSVGRWQFQGIASSLLESRKADLFFLQKWDK